MMTAHMNHTIDQEKARNLILRRLKRDKNFHERAEFDKMGETHDDFDREFPKGYPDLMIAWTFWDSWMDERKQGFPNLYSGISKDTWPQLAGQVIEQLERKAPISNPLILTHFDFTEKPGVFDRLKSMLGFWPFRK